MMVDLAHEKVNVAMPMGLEDDVAVLLRGDLASRVLQCGDAVLLHQRDMLRMQSVVVVLLKHGEDAASETRRRTRTRCECRHWS